jgi:hypothetical protein
MRGWSPIFSSPSPQEAELVRSMLEAHDLNAVILDQRSSPYPQVGETEVLVPQADVVRALYLVRKHREA